MQCLAFTLSTDAQLGRCAPKRGKTRQKRPLFGYRLITRFYRPRLACCHARQGARSAAAGQRGTLPPRCRSPRPRGRCRGRQHEVITLITTTVVVDHHDVEQVAGVASRIDASASSVIPGVMVPGRKKARPPRWEDGLEKRMPLRGDGAMGPFTILGAAFSPREIFYLKSPAKTSWSLSRSRTSDASSASGSTAKVLTSHPSASRCDSASSAQSKLPISTWRA